uniref:C-C motif chemokine 4-like n=1 Tax=Scatophagus argus TaxID=75038 RepID=UPI001ED85729|nr:C-C motif chemokine 4-like [Scatophagus argus]
MGWSSAKNQSQQRQKKNIIITKFTDSIMKTLWLLLLIACCCNAMPYGLQLSTSPGNCCFNFFTRDLPIKRVSGIIKTHSSCQNKAFIVQTIRGKQICYSQTFPWALDVYNRLYNTVSSGLQP